MLPRLSMTIGGAPLNLYSNGLAITIPTDLSDQDRFVHRKTCSICEQTSVDKIPVRLYICALTECECQKDSLNRFANPPLGRDQRLCGT